MMDLEEQWLDGLNTTIAAFWSIWNHFVDCFVHLIVDCSGHLPFQALLRAILGPILGQLGNCSPIFGYLGLIWDPLRAILGPFGTIFIFRGGSIS